MLLSCKNWQVPWTGEASIWQTPVAVTDQREYVAVSSQCQSHSFVCVKTKTSFISRQEVSSQNPSDVFDRQQNLR